MSVHKPTIVSLLDELQDYLGRIDRMEFTLEELQDDPDIQDLITHRLHTAVETCIDIAQHLSAGLSLPAKDAASDVFSLLTKEQVITKSTANQLSQAVGFRNLVVHQYADLDFHLLFAEYKQDVVSLYKFAQEIITYLKTLT
jgi:uncharacterized protein YutE (UPF0331/DUF86 family)